MTHVSLKRDFKKAHLHVAKAESVVIDIPPTLLPNAHRKATAKRAALFFDLADTDVFPVVGTLVNTNGEGATVDFSIDQNGVAEPKLLDGSSPFVTALVASPWTIKLEERSPSPRPESWLRDVLIVFEYTYELAAGHDG